MDDKQLRRPARRLAAALMAALAMLAGCSVLRLGYDQGPTLVYWWLDGYADFDRLQAPRVHAALDEWFRWHRRTQLPEYAELLVRLEAEIPHSAQPEQLCRWIDEARARMTLAVEHALPALAEIAPTLSAAQLQHIERRYAKSNQEFAGDFLQDTPERRREASVKRTVKRAEMLYGSLDERQREVIVRGIAASPFDADLWMAERRASQQDVLSTLRGLIERKPSPRDAEAALRELAQRFEHSPNDTWRRYEQRLLAYNCAFGAEIQNATSVTQRRTALERLKGWESDLRALAAQAVPAAAPAPN